MDCKKARFQIHLYMDHDLTPEELEPFIRHVRNCPDCYEELEVNYIMIEGMRRLENGEKIAVNFQKELDLQLHRQLQKIVRKRRARIRIIIIGVLVSLFGILLGSFEQEEHEQSLMQQMIVERGQYYYYEHTRSYIFEDGSYIPTSLREIVHYGK